MKWIYLNHDGRDDRHSLKTRSWAQAEKFRQQIEDSLDPIKVELRRLQEKHEAQRMPIVDAVEHYLSDLRRRCLSDNTQRSARWILRKDLLPWTEHNGLSNVDELTLPQLTKWSSTWSSHLGPGTMLTWQNRLVAFFNFCLRQGWCQSSPASGLSKIKVPGNQTGYFRRAEFAQILNATKAYGLQQTNPPHAIRKGIHITDSNKNCAARLRVFVLLLRWSGLRIGDAATLERTRLDGDSVLVRQSKTGNPVYVCLPPQVAEALRTVPPGPNPHLRYFFWSGRGRRSSAASYWQKKLNRLFELTDIRVNGVPKHCHPHMFRHTFAIELLLAGVPIDQVSKLLGHASVKTTEQYYAPWVLERQQQAEKSVRKAWYDECHIESAAPVAEATNTDEGVRYSATAANSGSGEDDEDANN
jgi:integrase